MSLDSSSLTFVQKTAERKISLSRDSIMDRRRGSHFAHEDCTKHIDSTQERPNAAFNSATKLPLFTVNKKRGKDFQAFSSTKNHHPKRPKKLSVGVLRETKQVVKPQLRNLLVEAG